MLKEKLIILLVSALSRLKGDYTINKDACNPQIGHELLQQQKETVLKPIGYRFCSFCNAETRYGSTCEEYLEVVWAVLLRSSY